MFVKLFCTSISVTWSFGVKRPDIKKYFLSRDPEANHDALTSNLAMSFVFVVDDTRLLSTIVWRIGLMATLWQISSNNALVMPLN